MNRYLKITEPSASDIEWLVRLVGGGDYYIDMRSGTPVRRVADANESYVLEFSVRSITDPKFSSFKAIGAATPSQLTSDKVSPAMAYNGFTMSPSPSIKRIVLAWVGEGFPYGGCIESPAIVSDLVIAVIDSGTFKRFPMTTFAPESKVDDMEMDAIRIVQGKCSPHEGQVQMVTYSRQEADELTDEDMRAFIMEVCQGQ